MSPFSPTFTSTPLVKIINLDDLLIPLNNFIQHLNEQFSILRFEPLVFASSFFVLLAYALLRLCCFLFPSHLSDRASHHASALKTLSKVFIPSGSSLWPARYLCFVHPTKRRITVPVSQLVDELLSGALEFRNAAEDLPILLAGAVSVDGWSIEISVSWKELCEVIKWGICSQIAILSNQFRSTSPPIGLDMVSSEEQELAQTICAPYLPLLDTSQLNSVKPLETLQSALLSFSIRPYLPRQQLETAILAIKERFQRDDRHLAVLFVTVTGSDHSLNTKNDNLGLFPPKHVILALEPFIRRHSVGHGLQPMRFTITLGFLIPLFASKSGCSILPTHHVLSMHNISIQHASRLEHYVSRLEYDNKTRADCLRRLGLRGWREERVQAIWEAAVMRMGLTERWAIVLGKN